MLTVENLLEKMIVHFPKWMDIRKRTKTSTGGQYLMAIAEEGEEIQKAITAFKDDFFIDRYTGKEDSVVAFVYKLQIGQIDLKKLVLKSPAFSVIEDIAAFYKATGNALYSDGYLFFRTEDILENNLMVQYTLDSFEMSGALEKMHVWNIFDEFATFAGIQRYENETNKELENRIYSVFREPANSTEIGLKNSILSALKNIDPDLAQEEIKIERPTPENLVKYYKEFGSVLEKLANVNRDVYRTKRWDVDPWNYTFKSVDYLPHAWDVFIEEYQNGVGFEDDLKISLLDPNAKTNATISVLKESSLRLSEYVKNHDVKANINLELKQFNNVLKPSVAKYKITAANVKEITAEPIVFNFKETSYSTEKLYLKDAEIISTKDIEIIDNATLPKDTRAMLSFVSENPYGTMEIKRCNLISNGSTTSLITAKDGFVLGPDNILRYSGVKAYVTQREQFVDYINMINTENGMSLEKPEAVGKLTFDCSNMQNEFYKIEYGCKSIPVQEKQIFMNGFTKNNLGFYTTIDTVIEHNLEVQANANQISFTIVEGNFTVNVSASDGYSFSKICNGPGEFITDIRPEAKDMVIRILPIGSSKVIVRDFKYSQFNIRHEFEKGTPTEVNGKKITPSDIQNKLFVTLENVSGFSPWIKFIHFGTSLENAKYTVEIPVTVANKQLDIISNCLLDLQPLNAQGQNDGPVVKNYKPYAGYMAKSNEAFIQLEIDNYTKLEFLFPEAGYIEPIGTGSNVTYYVRLKANDVISQIKITGEKLVNSQEKTLAELLNADTGSGDKIYVSALSNDFMIVNGTSQIKKSISSDLINFASRNCTVSGMPEEVACAFILDEEGKVESVSSSHTGQFKKIRMYPKEIGRHIAYNQCNIMSKELSDVQIVDVFDPLIAANKLMYYQVESIDSTATTNVRFEASGIPFENLVNWSVGRKSLRIVNLINMMQSSNYEIQLNHFNDIFELHESIPLQRRYTLSNGEVIELPKYLITAPEQMSIHYKMKSPLQTITDAPEFFSSESFIIEEDSFNKVAYSNIDEIIYIGTTPYNPDNPSSHQILPADSYSVLKAEGILLFDLTKVSASEKVYIVYTIKIPDYINVDPSLIYKTIEYDLAAYELAEAKDLIEIDDNYTFDLKTMNSYNSASKISIFCSKPEFEVVKTNDLLTFKRRSQENVVAINTGFYYLDGQEYYLFADQTNGISVDKFLNVSFFSVDREDGEMILNKTTKNYIRNSYMELGRMDDIYNVNLTEVNDYQGISRLNSITACNSFNHWQTFGVNLSLAQGVNGLGIKIERLLPDGYIMLDITDYLLDETFISFFADPSITAFIGKEIKYNNMSLNKSYVVKRHLEMTRSIVDSTLLETTFVPEDDYRYFLVILGNGIVDDILLNDKQSLVNKKDMHKKNIDILNLKIEEKINASYTSRLFINSNKCGKCIGAEVTETGLIVNSTMIDWGLTLVKKFDDAQSWTRCITNNVAINNGIAQTKNAKGSIKTESIYLGDIRTIKSVIFKINDVVLDSLSGFTVKVKKSNTLNGEYIDAKTFSYSSSNLTNIGHIMGNELMPYIQLHIDMPANKTIKNVEVYVEYKSTETAAPQEIVNSNGSFLSEVLDTRYSAKYKLKEVNLTKVSDLKNITIQIRAARENYAGDVWSDWKTVTMDNTGIKEPIIFDNYRFFQVRVTLKTKDSFVGIKNIDLEAVL